MAATGDLVVSSSILLGGDAIEIDNERVFFPAWTSSSGLPTEIASSGTYGTNPPGEIEHVSVGVPSVWWNRAGVTTNESGVEYYTVIDPDNGFGPYDTAIPVDPPQLKSGGKGSFYQDFGLRDVSVEAEWLPGQTDIVTGGIGAPMMCVAPSESMFAYSFWYEAGWSSLGTPFIMWAIGRKPDELVILASILIADVSPALPSYTVGDGPITLKMSREDNIIKCYVSYSTSSQTVVEQLIMSYNMTNPENTEFEGTGTVPDDTPEAPAAMVNSTTVGVTMQDALAANAQPKGNLPIMKVPWIVKGVQVYIKRHRAFNCN